MPVEGNTQDRPQRLAGVAPDVAGQISLCEVLDRVLNKGVVVSGEATVSVCDIDLIYLGLQIVLTSMETARQSSCRAPVKLGVGMGIREEKTHGSIWADTGRVRHSG